MKHWIAGVCALSQLCFGEGIGFSGPKEAEISGEFLSSNDIKMQSYLLRFSGSEEPWVVELGVGWNAYDIDYSPVLFGTDESISEEALLLNVNLTRRWNKEWSGGLSLRAYEGYSDYRSIWIAEFYKQFFGGFEEYYSPDPDGQAIGGSVSWDYLPGAGVATLSVNLGRDEIAPGWSFNSAEGFPEADREVLKTVSGSLRAEQAINGWLKTEGEFSLRKTTDRDLRFGIRNSWAAVSGPFGFRLSGGYAEESPSFDALYAVALAEWNFIPQWSAYVGFRIYEDSGEIEASGFNASAPAVDNTEWFGGVRWDRGDLSVSATVGFLQSDYAALSEDNEFFGNLYKDRDWWNLRIAATYQF